jgi:Tyrosyl-DNA phosphodiesterase
MTTFEPPDAALLVEHLLPSLLDMNPPVSQEGKERNVYFGELGTSLEALRGRFSIISSPAKAERQHSQYPWLWRYVSHYTVGEKKHAVQHAKLWAFHWGVGGKRLLELRVSSTNLTTSAFKDQLQAGWQATLPLGNSADYGKSETWGELARFLKSIGASAGTAASTRTDRLIALLDRVECPKGVHFIASIPGEESAAQQLKKFMPSELHIFTPTIGNWDDVTLLAWASDVGLDRKKLHLKWISDQHPWSKSDGWVLTPNTEKLLSDKNLGVQLERFPSDAALVDEHLKEDPRWSHAKLYLLRKGKKSKLLVTSANWSASAWGAGSRKPRDFELGVIFESEWLALKDIGETFTSTEKPYCVDRKDKKKESTLLEWAQATWDGTSIELRARSSSKEPSAIEATISFYGEAKQRRVSLLDGVTSLPWADSKQTPINARFTQETEDGVAALDVDVLDLRAPQAFAETPLPEVDPSLAADLRERFLLQRYGGTVVDDDSNGSPQVQRLRGDAIGAAADYTLQAWVEARACFAVIDQWCAAYEQAAEDKTLREHVLFDGEELLALFRRRVGPANELVAEELGWRLEEGMN